MPDRYEITFGEVRTQYDRSTRRGINSLGAFSTSFVVKPPIKFLSEQASLELSQHVLERWQLEDPENLYLSNDTSALSNRANLTFSHELADGSGTVGAVSGDFRRDELGLEHLQKALDIVLNGEDPK